MTLQLTDLAALRRKRSETEVRKLEELRLLRSLKGKVRQVDIAAALGISQSAVSQVLKSADRVMDPPQGFAGSGPLEIAQRYNVDELTREEVIDQLGRWNYEPESSYDVIDGSPLTASHGGTWSETVGRALDQGLIDNQIYDAALAIAASRAR